MCIVYVCVRAHARMCVCTANVHFVFVSIRNELIVIWELNLEEQGVSKVS